MKINILYLYIFRNIIFSTSVKPINVQNIKNNPCRETIDWDNISSHSENEEVDQPSKITSDADANAKTTIEECSDETSFKNQGTVKQILIYFNCMFNT